MPTYKAGNKSDMERFKRDLKNTLMKKTKQVALNKEYDIDCPFCHQTITISAGKHLCPKCHQEITLELDFNF
nr:MAG TPA: ribosome, girodazole, girolline, antibiotic complex, 50S [Caudoviricetes sp.]